jgi:hypothetical protein
MKIRSVEGELFHADRKTDMTKLIVAFRNLANVPEYHSFTAAYCIFVFSMKEGVGIFTTEL